MRDAQKTMFLEYRIESKADNRISFFVKLDNLGRALKSCVTAQTQPQASSLHPVRSDADAVREPHGYCVRR